jgi:hypothetical protein
MSHESKPFRKQTYVSPVDGDLDDNPYLNTVPANMDNSLQIEEIQVGNNYSEISGKGDFIPLLAHRFIQSASEIKMPDVKPFKLYNTQKPYTTQDRIEQAQNGLCINLCISSPKQDITKASEELQNDHGQVYFTISHNYQKLEDGSLEMINKYLLKKQKQVLGYLIKQFGSALVSGKSIMSISLPITIFEPRSLLERLGDSYVFGPHFLEKAGQIKDTLEQFKLAFTFLLTTLASDLNPEKPFNPILGETFQGVIGGCPVYFEQISHHPPMAAFQMVGKHFSVEGYLEFNASISTNSVKCRKIGDFRVVFKNTGTVIQAQFPTGVMSGTSFGKRTWQWTRKLQAYDLKNNYYAEIDFDKSEPSKKRKEMAGYFSSNIYKITDKFAAKAGQEMKKQKDVDIKFKEKDHSTAKLDKIEGSWLESLTINDQVYWSYANPYPYKLHYFDNPLPSDCNFRLDLLHLKSGDEIKSQEAKVFLEEIQRKDRKGREQIKSKNYK